MKSKFPKRSVIRSEGDGRVGREAREMEIDEHTG